MPFIGVCLTSGLEDIWGGLFIFCSPSNSCEQVIFLWSSIWALGPFFLQAAAPTIWPHLSLSPPWYFWEVEAVAWCRKANHGINLNPAYGMKLGIFIRQHRYHNLHFHTLGECCKQLRLIRWDGSLSSLPFSHPFLLFSLPSFPPP